MIRRDCWRQAATCPPSGCWPPTGAGSSPGTRPASRCCGGPRIRAPCCMPQEFRLTRSLAKTLRNRGFSRRIDRNFQGVIDGCAAPRARSPGTWLLPEMRAAYLELHRLGHAHSFETWLDGALVGGLYGIRLGNVFFGESMFSLERDASKAPVARLVEYCRSRGRRRHRLPATLAAPAQPGQPADLPDAVSGPVARAHCNGDGVCAISAPQCLKKMRFRWRVRSSRLCPIPPSA